MDPESTVNAIELTGLSKAYGIGSGARVVLNSLDLVVEQGQFVSLTGPSGSGKSTLLNLIAGLDTPDSGRIVVTGRVLGGLADHELADLRLQKIGFVFQSFNLLPALTVWENVAWPLEYSGRSKADVRTRVARALERAGIGGRDRNYPSELSGGEQQRVAIARSIAPSPILLLADEPTGNLDSQTGGATLDLLRDLNRTDGVTIVMVTHNLFAATYGDRTIELRDGRIVHDVRAPAVEENESTERLAE